MELQELRELHKKYTGKYPSSKTKQETIEKKLEPYLIEETIEIKKEIKETESKIVTTENLQNHSIKTEAPKWVRKMTSKIFNALKAKGKI